jgi:hypothetical protein
MNLKQLCIKIAKMNEVRGKYAAKRERAAARAAEKKKPKSYPKGQDEMGSTRNVMDYAPHPGEKT